MLRLTVHLIIILCCGPLGPIAAQAGPIAQRSQIGPVWNVNQIARQSSRFTTLEDVYGRPLKQVSVGQIRKLRRIFRKLERSSELDARLLIMPGELPNALAGPVDGRNTVAVNFAMWDLVGDRQDEWAAILGHELAHLKLDHFTKGLMRSLPLQLIQKLIKKKTDNTNTHLATDLLARLIDTKYSRDQERQSDYLGAVWAVEAGFSPHGAATLHQRMYELVGNNGIPFLNSHPSGPERIKSLSELALRLDTRSTHNRKIPVTADGYTSQDLSKAELLRVGMVPKTVRTIMGAPAMKDDKEWHYCKTGKSADEFVAVRYENGRVSGIQEYRATFDYDNVVIGDCQNNIKRGTYRVTSF